jgi:hypothetical protein
MLENAVVGALIGLLCGVVPLIVGLLARQRDMGLAALLVCLLAGALFGVIGAGIMAGLAVIVIHWPDISARFRGGN